MEKRKSISPQRLIDTITSIGFYGVEQEVITSKSNTLHNTIIPKKEPSCQDINRDSINRILQYKDKTHTIPSSLVFQLFISQRYFENGHFNWTNIEQNWDDSNPPKSKASLKRTDFKSQCKKWLESFQRKEWVHIKKSNIGIGLYFKKDVHHKDMGNMLKELEADVWMCNVGSGCNSTTEVNTEIKDNNKTTIYMSGIGIVYGLTLL